MRRRAIRSRAGWTRLSAPGDKLQLAGGRVAGVDAGGDAAAAGPREQLALFEGEIATRARLAEQPRRAHLRTRRRR